MLMGVSEDGTTLVFEDGSKWSVNPGDMPTACIWIPTAQLEVKRARGADLFSHEVVNVGTGERILTRPE